MLNTWNFNRVLFSWMQQCLYLLLKPVRFLCIYYHYYQMSSLSQEIAIFFRKITIWVEQHKKKKTGIDLPFTLKLYYKRSDRNTVTIEVLKKIIILLNSVLPFFCKPSPNVIQAQVYKFSRDGAACRRFVRPRS